MSDIRYTLSNLGSEEIKMINVALQLTFSMPPGEFADNDFDIDKVRDLLIKIHHETSKQEITALTNEQAEQRRLERKPEMEI